MTVLCSIKTANTKNTHIAGNDIVGFRYGCQIVCINVEARTLLQRSRDQSSYAYIGMTVACSRPDYNGPRNERRRRWFPYSRNTCAVSLPWCYSTIYQPPPLLPPQPRRLFFLRPSCTDCFFVFLFFIVLHFSTSSCSYHCRSCSHHTLFYFYFHCSNRVHTERRRAQCTAFVGHMHIPMYRVFLFFFFFIYSFAVWSRYVHGPAERTQQALNGYAMQNESTDKNSMVMFHRCLFFCFLVGQPVQLSYWVAARLYSIYSGR